MKRHVPDLIVITDVCLCEYVARSLLTFSTAKRLSTTAPVSHLVQVALSHAVARADFVAPSDMMDGRVGAIRLSLDAHGFEASGSFPTPPKCCSAFYGPFREAADSAPQFGDRRSHQMDPANVEERCARWKPILPKAPTSSWSSRR